MTSPLPVTFSLAGRAPREEEARFFQENQPYGFILFKRNIDSPEQLQTLTQTLRNLTRPDCPILIDQEGGRVQRLNTPHWPKYPCMKECQDETTLKHVISALSKDLKKAGINTNCAPVLDVLQPDTDLSIGDRAFSEDPEIVAKLGRIACETFIENGITPIIKHLPGHGRAVVDSHEEVPYVSASLEELREIDFYPFQAVLRQDELGNLAGMVGHCLYTEIDPELPASLSPVIIQDIIRDEIGLSGKLFSDDLSMGALSKYGDIAERAEICLEAGCDIALYCAGNLDEMKAIAHKLS